MRSKDNSQQVMRTRGRKLSSGTWAVRRLLPAFCVLFLTAWLLVPFGVVRFIGTPSQYAMSLAGILLASSFSLYFAWRTKDVWIGKDCLVVESGGRKERIALSEIASVYGSSRGNFHPVWITFKRQTPVGRTIVFFSGYHLLNFGRNEVAHGLNELLERRARRGKALKDGDKTTDRP